MAPPPLNEVLSSVLGYVSIATWVVVFFPQIIENYKRKSADSLSLPFLIIWLLGDITNLIGGLWQHVLDTMIYLAVYYTVADTILIFQVFYYKRSKRIEEEIESIEEPSAQTPLLADQRAGPKPDYLPELQARERAIRYRRQAVQFGLSFLGVVLVGVLAWYFAGHEEQRGKHPIPPPPEEMPEFDVSAQILGWISAVLYLGSRLPQIYKNYKMQSCEGLSLAMFFFSLLGNITYCASIFVKSLDANYLVTNLAWILGSGGTIFFDMIIFVQFYIYRDHVTEEVTGTPAA